MTHVCMASARLLVDDSCASVSWAGQAVTARWTVAATITAPALWVLACVISVRIGPLGVTVNSACQAATAVPQQVLVSTVHAFVTCGLKIASSLNEMMHYCASVLDTYPSLAVYPAVHCDMLWVYTGCKQCECNGHGDPSRNMCNVTTGQCFCTQNTRGNKCNECHSGYYGDPS